MKTRIMYIENKSGGLDCAGRIGRVSFSKTGRTLYYNGRAFRSLKGSGFKSNYYDIKTGEEYWISGPRKDGNDRLYGRQAGVQIDDDVKDDYNKYIKGVDFSSKDIKPNLPIDSSSPLKNFVRKGRRNIKKLE